MGVVDVCPRRQIDITTASKKLGCKNDTYGNNKYMCVPKDDKSSLVEICYDGNMGIEEPGACLEATHGGIRRFNCSAFMYGCPDDPFHRYNVYKYPACQDINVQHRCYVLDPSCPSQPNGNGVLYAVIGVLIVGILISVGVYLIRKCLSKKEPAAATELLQRTDVTEPAAATELLQRTDVTEPAAATELLQRTDVTEPAAATELLQRTDFTDPARGLLQRTYNIDPARGFLQNTDNIDPARGLLLCTNDIDFSLNSDTNWALYSGKTEDPGIISSTPKDTYINYKVSNDRQYQNMERLILPNIERDFVLSLPTNRKLSETYPNYRGHGVQNMQKNGKLSKTLQNNREHDALNMQTAQASEENRKILKVLCHKTQIQKGVILVDPTMDELKKICADKFELDEEELQSMHFVLNEDGTEIDDEYLQTLEKDTLLILKTHEQLSLC